MSYNLTSKDLTKTILLLAGTVILLPALAASPGLGYLLKPLLKKNYPPARINQSLRRLEKQRLISIREENDQIKIGLEEKGKRKLLFYKLDDMTLKTGKWDGWWRIIIFDIPDKQKSARDFLRYRLKNLNFYMLQKSVLVTPWECRNEVDFIKNLYGVEKHVQLVTAKHFDGEEEVMSYFRL